LKKEKEKKKCKKKKKNKSINFECICKTLKKVKILKCSGNFKQN